MRAVASTAQMLSQARHKRAVPGRIELLRVAAAEQPNAASITGTPPPEGRSEGVKRAPARADTGRAGAGARGQRPGRTRGGRRRAGRAHAQQHAQQVVRKAREPPAQGVGLGYSLVPSAVLALAGLACTPCLRSLGLRACHAYTRRACVHAGLAHAGLAQPAVRLREALQAGAAAACRTSEASGRLAGAAERRMREAPNCMAANDRIDHAVHEVRWGPGMSRTELCPRALAEARCRRSLGGPHSTPTVRIGAGSRGCAAAGSACMQSSGILTASVQAVRAGAAPVVAGARELQQRGRQARGRALQLRQPRQRARQQRAPASSARPPRSPAARGSPRARTSSSYVAAWPPQIG